MKTLSLLSLLIISFGLLAGCSDDNPADADQMGDPDMEAAEPEPEEVDMSEPITLLINDWRGDETFEEMIKTPVEEEFPNVTLELLPIMPYKDSLEEQFANGIIPDIIMGPDFRYIPVLEETELSFDLTRFIERFGFDLDRFDQNFLNIIRSYTNDSKELWGLPYMQNKAALHYNKDIFDLFGVPYPTDDMTYEEVIDLASQVTGERGGTEFTGLVMPSADRYIFPPLGLTLLDPETDQPKYLEEPAFQDVFATYQHVDEFQGGESSVHGDSATSLFISEQRLAMLPMYFLGLDWTGLLEAQEQGMNWDIVTFPKWEGQEDVSAFADGYWLGISPYSEHQEQAFKVIEFLLSDEEIVRKIRYPEESVYLDEQFLAVADDLRNPLLEDKNMEALYKYPAPLAPEGRSRYEELAKSVVNEMLPQFLDSSQDVNSFLRELQEETERRIAEEQSRE